MFSGCEIINVFVVASSYLFEESWCVFRLVKNFRFQCLIAVSDENFHVLSALSLLKCIRSIRFK